MRGKSSQHGQSYIANRGVELERASFGDLEGFFRKVVRDEVGHVLDEKLASFRHEFLGSSAADVASRSVRNVEFITLAEAARRCHRSVRTLTRWRRDGLRAYGARNNLIDPEELQTFIRRGEARAEAVRSDEEQAEAILSGQRRREEG